ncbi:DUF4292 domain-containing protein [Parabacteroides sp. PF5-9]|uniref:DUF4292 domain-containing protein n=1 Tax=Parabacteroides sp. PF5-9 TaxID=1742404 RepID=UPI002476953C|nr:DUF4292 domain-containing protein [Parabacteroides sp. PF5-9]MDH6356878.1 outer membrane lipoprotein-sorting protein [Parabacteroides sp. PF5-9]
MRRRSIQIILSFGLAVIFLAGCKTTKKVGTVDIGTAKEHAEFFDAMKEKAFHFQTLSARVNAQLHFSGSEMSSRVDLKIVKDSALIFSIQPFLGVEVARIILDQEHIRIIDRINKRFVDESYANLKGQTPIDFNFYNLQALFINHLFLPGQQTISPVQYRQFQLQQEGSTAEVRTKDAMDLTYTFTVDGEEKLLSTFVTDAKERHAIQWEYADFRITDGQPFPMLMVIQVLSEGLSKGHIQLNFARIQTNIPVNMDFSIPDKYKRITFAEIIRAFNKNR